MNTKEPVQIAMNHSFLVIMQVPSLKREENKN
jgi:hypothetical protein